MTATYAINIYDILFPVIKSEAKTKELVQNIELVIDKKFEDNKNNLATRDDILNLEVRIEKRLSDMNKAIYIVGLIQFIAIVGSVLAIVSFAR
jgi:hypothetical protein